MNYGINRSEVSMLNEDIRFIKNQTNLKSLGSVFFGSFLHFSLVLAFPLIALLLLFVRKKQSDERKDEKSYRQKKASKTIRKYLSESEKALQGNDLKSYYNILGSAIWNYFQDKFKLDQSALTRDIIGDKLREIKLTDSDIQEINKVIDKLEMLRFAPDSQENKPESMLEEVKNIIEKIENQ